MNKVLREILETLEAFLLIAVFFVLAIIILFISLIAQIFNKSLF